MEFENIQLEKRGGIARITLNRPEKLNALSAELLAELEAACDDIEKDYDTRVVILTGSGRAFSSGFDIAPRERHDIPSVERWDNTHQAPKRLLRFHYLRQPTIAAVNGYAIAAGNVLAMSCDIVLASEAAQFGEPEIRHVAHSPFTFLPYIMPLKHANWLYLTGETIDARTAERFGMVNKVLAPDALEAEAWRAAESIARVGAFSTQLMKRSVNQTLDKMGYSEAFEHHLVLRAWEGLVPLVPEKDKLNKIRDESGLKAFLEERDTFFADRLLYQG
ncbi:MAG: enoyl-CoA hydratase/isomerase family protein [Dehalococcoidia bacterium]